MSEQDRIRAMLSAEHARLQRYRTMWALAAAVLVGLLLALPGCATTGRSTRLRAEVGIGADTQAQGGAAMGGWAAKQTRVVILARGKAGWPTAVQGAVVRAFDPSSGVLHEETTGPDGAASFQGRGPLQLWVKLGEDAEPEVIAWNPQPDDTVPNQGVIVYTLGGGR